MKLGDLSLEALSHALRESSALRAKQDVQRVSRNLPAAMGGIRNGDDAAAIPDRDGFTLVAAEGMLPSFVAAEPFFAGLCAVMTNVSDIAAMGGRPVALVDVLFAGSDGAQTDQILAGLHAGAETFGVPLVGGHTARSADRPYLAAAIVGRARRLITSFDVRPGDRLLACIDVRGAFRGDSLNFDAVSGRQPAHVRAQLELLPELAEAGLVHAGKDISMAGLVGTLLMLLETSGCGARVDLGAVPAPAIRDAEALRWLQAFPSFGYLLASRPDATPRVLERCDHHGVSAAVIGEACSGGGLELEYGEQRVKHWDLTRDPVLGFAPQKG